MTDLGFLQKPKKVVALQNFLTQRGAEVLPPTNPYEVLRFRAASGVNVIYRNEGWQITPIGADIVAAIQAFQTGLSWHALPKRKQRPRPHARRVRQIIRALRQRDGDGCFYCGQPCSEEDESIEHLLSRATEGPDRLENYVLAHRSGNNDAGVLPIMLKIRIREANLREGKRCL